MSTYDDIDDAYDAGRSDGWDDGIREGERRMLRLVFIGAACAEVLYGHIAERATPATVVASCVLLYVAKTQAEAALSALAASGDEDASRVLGERGW